MRRFFALLLFSLAALAAPGCRETPEGAPRVVVIGGQPQLTDPTRGPLAPPDAVLLENVAQGLVRFDATGNIVGGLAERWNVSDDGLSYIFRIASANWPDGSKITAQQVAKILKRAVGPRSQDSLKDAVGAIEDIVPMTDRVIEIRLVAPRPNLLALLAQPEFAILRGRMGTGPFSATPDNKVPGQLRLTRNVLAPDEESTTKEQVLLSGAAVQQAIHNFAANNTDLVLGGTFADLPYAQHVKLPGGALQFDPASGLFGLMPLHATANRLDDPDVRRLLSQAIDRDAITAALGVPNLAARATLLEPGLDGMPPPIAPAWIATPLADRLPSLRVEADRDFGGEKPTIRIALPEGPGAELVLALIARSWGSLGIGVERAPPATADFALIDEVAPSTSAAWFVRRFHCGAAAVCDPEIDQLMDAARQSPVPQQRYALLQQAASRIDDAYLFMPITAPVRWSLVGKRIQGFAGNRFAVHTLTDLEKRPGTGN